MTIGRGQAAGFGWAVASPHTSTSAAAMAVLAGGGNAVDAAIAANAVQGAVAPETCGIGGDLFALVWEAGAGRPHALNASGWAGSNASAAEMRDQGHVSIPLDHPASVSIPGAVAGWFELADRFGSRPVSDLLTSAVELCREGFAASDEFVGATTARLDQLLPQSSGAELYPGGRPAAVGERIRRPMLADSLDRIRTEGAAGFYRGEIAAAISAATDGLITVDDLAAYRPDWIEPARADVMGATGWTIGPNSQGYLTLATLRIFEMTGGPYDPHSPDSHHRLVEAYRAVAAERDDVVTDARFAPMTAPELLADDRLERIAARLGPRAGVHRPPGRVPGGTAYLCVVDADGMGVSLIQSNFHGIGSGIGVGSTGFLLHNRGAGASLVAGHPNELAPGKRPLHTLSPTIWSRGDRLATVLGTRGGHQQPQLLAQVAANLHGAGDEPWKAQARPRWTTHSIAAGSPSELSVEAAVGDTVVADLRRRGHQVEVVDGPTGGWGPISLITIGDDGLRTAAADPRVDTALAIAT